MTRGKAVPAPIRHSLGAEEVIELGRGGSSEHPGRKPFFLGRAILGGNSAGEFMSRRLDVAIDLFGSLTQEESGRPSPSMAGTVVRAPALKDVLGEILVLGGAKLAQGPNEALREVMANSLDTLRAVSGDDQVADILDESARRIVMAAPPAARVEVEKSLLV